MSRVHDIVASAQVTAYQIVSGGFRGLCTEKRMWRHLDDDRAGWVEQVEEQIRGRLRRQEARP